MSSNWLLSQTSVQMYGEPRWLETQSEDDEERKTNIILTNSVDSLLYYESCHTLQVTCKLNLPDLGLVSTVEDAGRLLLERRRAGVAEGGGGPLLNILHSMAKVLGRREEAFMGGAGPLEFIPLAPFWTPASGFTTVAIGENTVAQS